ncbi:hypothetical protein [Variovorax rhizosphaerae]|uniref:Uncharacterized protein n=1 Tax=Variovorax rhizosphaerae TaxID=1836200 RepID=A0ABU8WZ55_9BURK
MLTPSPRLLLILMGAFSSAAWSAPNSVYLEDLTSTEVRDAAKAGTTTIALPARKKKWPMIHSMP